MAIKTVFTKNEMARILSNYDLGELICFEPVANGTVETNYFVTTTLGKFVFRYYEERSKESVQFEVKEKASLGKFLGKRKSPNVRGFFARSECESLFFDFVFLVII